jgi:CubicO group peptidase (beta-lactamase class C family)
MTHHRLAAILMFLCVWAPSTVHAAELPSASPSEVGMSDSKLAAVDAAMEQLVADKKIAGGVVAVVRHGKVCLLNAYGQRDLAPDAPMQTDTVFRIYSMSKAIVTAAALTLVDEGRLSLDDPLTKYVPELEGLRVLEGEERVPLARPITIADLMRHTAGMSYGMGDDAVDQIYLQHQPLDAENLDGMAQRLANVPLRNQPGAKWVYSVSIDVLGLVIERVSGQPLDVYLKERIFEPLDMKDTGFYCPAGKHGRFAALYNQSEDGLTLSDGLFGMHFDQSTTMFSGGGGLVSTARDYLHFLVMIQNGGELFGNRVLKPETVALMTSNQLPPAAFPIGFGTPQKGVGFGYGFSVRVDPDPEDPHRPVGEYGWSGAASTHYWVSPTDDLIVVTLEQRRPFTTETMGVIKPLVYDAVVER